MLVHASYEVLRPGPSALRRQDACCVCAVQGCGRRGCATATKPLAEPACAASLHSCDRVHRQGGQTLDDGAEGRVPKMSSLCKFAYIRACREGQALTCNHYCFCTIALGSIKPIPDALPHGVAERVNRRMCDADERDTAAQGETRRHGRGQDSAMEETMMRQSW